MIDIQKIAREAGYGKLQVTKHQTKWSIKDDELDKANRFATLLREALVAELLAGIGEPDGLWAFDETVLAWREYNREGFDSCTGTKLEAYTKDQLAGAVLRERERCAEVCEGLAVEAADSWSEDKDTEKAMRNGMLNFVCVISGQCAAAIRSGE